MQRQQVRTVVFLDDRLDVLCALAAKEDTYAYWYAGWLLLAQQAGGRSQVERLLDLTPDLYACRFSAEDSHTFFLVLYALLEVVQENRDFWPDQGQAALEALHEFLDSRFFFGRQPGQSAGDILVFVDGHGSLPLHLPDRQSGPARIEVEEWLGALGAAGQAGGVQGQQAEHSFMPGAILYHQYLYHSARLRQLADEQERTWVMLSFVTFCQALAERLERDDSHQPYRRHMDGLLEIIVQHEPDLGVARQSLLQLLRSTGPPTQKWQRLDRLVHRLARARHGSPPGETAALERAATLTSLIADHYLDNFDLEGATGIWRSLGLSDRWLASLLRLFRGTHWTLAFYAIVFLILTVLALSQKIGPPNRATQSGWMAVPLMLLLLLVPAWFAIGLLRDPRIRGLYYSQLFLPRMLGTIVVGLAALMLDDLPWRITLIMPGPLLLLLAAGVFLMSYLYIILDVYHAIRFESWPSRDPPAGPGGEPASATGHGSVLSRAARIALRVHSLGILQSFLCTLPVTGLMLPLIFPQTAEVGGAPWEDSFLGWIALPGDAASGPVFVFVPALVLLWTGMALFIGAFVQLLWQERHVTSPVSD
jgi:hypothetical protein